MGGICSVSAALRQEWNVAWPAHLPTALDPEIPMRVFVFPDDPLLSSWTFPLHPFCLPMPIPLLSQLRHDSLPASRKVSHTPTLGLVSTGLPHS